jgi:TPR repeat protein
VRLPITALATALLVAILPAVTSAQTAFGVLNVWLKARESADAPNDQQITLYKKSKALVIGMDHYSGGWPQLSNGIKDAEEVAKGLAAQGFEVTLKKDLKSEDLDRTLKDFFVRDGADVDTRLLLWFAGHGHTIRDEGYIVPIDAPSPKADADFRDKAISLRRFGEYMREANSRHVLAIFDSCFGGAVFNVARSLPPPAITLATTEPVREFISSGEADQQVSDDGTFRRLFLDVLAGKEPDADANHDGYVTGTELGLFLHQKMTNLTYNRQTPRYGKLNALGYDRGDFVFQVGKPDVPTTADVSSPQPTSEVAQAWAAAQGTTSQEVLEDFIKRYGESFYGTLARARLEELKKTRQRAEVAATQTPATAPSAATTTGAPATPTNLSRSNSPSALNEPQTKLSPPPGPIQQTPISSENLRLDRVTDCDRLAANPSDTQRPAQVAGIPADKIDTKTALKACNDAMRQYPSVARFVFQAGRVAYAQKEYTNAAHLFEKAVAMGSKIAMSGLGFLYNNGMGVPTDYAQAKQWFEKAAAEGEPDGMLQLEALYRTGRGVTKDEVQAFQWSEKAAATGNALAMERLGSDYQYGWGTAQDVGQAIQWYEKAAAAGDRDAMFDLGFLHELGDGVTKDYAEAREWYEKAAAAGNGDAMIRLGGLYKQGGFGVTQDYTKARDWCEKARTASTHLGDVNQYSCPEWLMTPKSKRKM